jgi:hypothetical protein
MDTSQQHKNILATPSSSEHDTLTGKLPEDHDGLKKKVLGRVLINSRTSQIEILCLALFISLRHLRSFLH